MKHKFRVNIFGLLLTFCPLLSPGQTMSVTSANPNNLSSDVTTVIDFNMSVVPDGATLGNGDIKVFDELLRPISGVLSVISQSARFTPSGSFRKGSKIYTTLVKNSFTGVGGETLPNDFHLKLENRPDSPPAYPFAFGSTSIIQLSPGQSFGRPDVTDMDGDNDLDIIISITSDGLYWYENDGSDNFTQHLIDNNNTNYNIYKSADLDQDGDLDFMDYSYGDDALVWYVNNGSNVFTKQTLVATVNSMNFMKVIDLDGDGDLDILGESNSKLSWFENDGSQNFSKTDLTAVIDVLTYDIGDLDSDGDLDIFIIQYNGTFFWKKNNGSEVFSDQFITVTQAGQPYANAQIHDLDNDGDADIMLNHGSNILIYKNNGGGSFVSTPGISSVGSILDVRDIGGNSMPDIITGSRIIENQGGFTFITGNPAFSATEIFPIDYDNDGDVDIVGRSSGSITLYKNAAKPGFSVLNPVVQLSATSAEVSWVASQPSDGTFEIINYKIEHTWDSEVEEINTSSNSTTYTFTNLLPGTNHFFKVNSINAVGESGYPGFSELISLPKAAQVISFEDIPDKIVTDPDFDLIASADSGLPVTFQVDSGPVTVNGNSVSITGAGDVQITASQAGNNNYLEAEAVTKTFTVDKIGQSITFSDLSDLVFSSGLTLTLSATASSNLTIEYTVTGPSASLSGNVVSFNAPGSYTISANQSGNETYLAAAEVAHEFCVDPAKPTVVKGPNGESVTLTSSASAGNQWFENGNIIAGETNNTLTVATPGIYKVQVTVDACVSEFSSDVVLIVTGDIDDANKNSTYPNPAFDVLTVSLNDFDSGKPVLIRILDLKGSLMTITKGIGKTERKIDISHYGSGNYIIIAEQSVKSKRWQFIKSDKK